MIAARDVRRTERRFDVRALPVDDFGAEARGVWDPGGGLCRARTLIFYGPEVTAAGLRRAAMRVRRWLGSTGLPFRSVLPSARSRALASASSGYPRHLTWGAIEARVLERAGS